MESKVKIKNYAVNGDEILECLYYEYKHKKCKTVRIGRCGGKVRQTGLENEIYLIDIENLDEHICSIGNNSESSKSAESVEVLGKLSINAKTFEQGWYSLEYTIFKTGSFEAINRDLGYLSYNGKDYGWVISIKSDNVEDIVSLSYPSDCEGYTLKKQETSPF